MHSLCRSVQHIDMMTQGTLGSSSDREQRAEVMTASLPAPLSQSRQMQRVRRHRAEQEGTKSKMVPILLLRLIVHFLLDQLTVHGHYLSGEECEVLDTRSPARGKRTKDRTECFSNIISKVTRKRYRTAVM